jgi:hypothetical protein
VISTAVLGAALVICAIVTRWLCVQGARTKHRRHFAAAGALSLIAGSSTWAYVERNVERTAWDLALGLIAIIYFAPKFARALQQFGQAGRGQR